MKPIKRILSFLLCIVLLALLTPTPVAEAAPSPAEVDEKIRWIIASIPDDCDTDYEKALWLHDYLCKTVVYDKAYSADEAYNPLIYGRADCGGYADAYTRLLRAVGITCGTVTGGTDAGPHAWNIIMLDGKCYFTDVTWDDIDSFGYINYGYFMISAEEMEEDHTASSVLDNTLYQIFLPEKCNHNEYDYFQNYQDTGKPGSGHFNNSTTAEEAVKHFKVVGIEGSTLFWQCEFEFDGDAADWVKKTERQLDKLLGGYTRVHGGMDGYGILKYECPNSVFTQIDAISFMEPTVYLNNSHMRQQLSVSFSPSNATYQDVTYSSSDSRIAKVDENGVVRAVSSGTATITATALDGKTTTCQVVVDHKHDAIRYVPAVRENCSSKGNKAHYICDSCGTLFSDSKGKNAISIMDVIIPALTYCRWVDCSVYYNAEGHWLTCNFCNKPYFPNIASHEDWTGDGICDGYGDSTPCGYVMNPSATKPGTTKPPATSGSNKPTTNPATQPATQPTTTPGTSVPPATESVPDSSVLDTENTSTATQPPSSGIETVPDSSFAPSSLPVATQAEEPPIFQWVILGLIGITAVIAIIIGIRRRKR